VWIREVRKLQVTRGEIEFELELEFESEIKPQRGDILIAPCNARGEVTKQKIDMA